MTRSTAKKVDDFKRDVRYIVKTIPDSIHSYDFSVYDDRDDDFAICALKALSSSGLTVDVYATVKFYNKTVDEVKDYFDKTTWNIRYYPNQYDDGKWNTTVEIDKTFSY